MAKKTPNNFFAKKIKRIEKWEKARKSNFGTKKCKVCLQFKQYNEYTSNHVRTCIHCTKINQLKSKWSRMRSDDKKKGRETVIDYISKEKFIELAMQPCTYCGFEESFGVDRIDNSLSHLTYNCIPCCGICNISRQNLFTVEEMKKIGLVIAEIKKQRINPLQKPPERQKAQPQTKLFIKDSL